MVKKKKKKKKYTTILRKENSSKTSRTYPDPDWKSYHNSNKEYPDNGERTLRTPSSGQRHHPSPPPLRGHGGRYSCLVRWNISLFNLAFKFCILDLMASLSLVFAQQNF